NAQVAARGGRALRERLVFGRFVRSLLGGSSWFPTPLANPRRRRPPAEISRRAGSQEGGHRGRTAGEDICRVFLFAADDAGHFASGHLFCSLATECGDSGGFG